MRKRLHPGFIGSHNRAQDLNDDRWRRSHINAHFPQAEQKADARFVEDVRQLEILYQRKQHWLDSVPWGWRAVAVAFFLFLAWLYAEMLKGCA